MTWSFLMVLLVGIIVLSIVPLMVIVERRGSAWMQRRVGPDRVGPLGLLQTIADAVKLVFKEENVPAQSHKILFSLAPVLAVLPPFFAFAVMPLAGSVVINGQEYNIGVSNLSVSVMFLLAISSLHVYSVLCAGWASNNKFSLMGALRSSSQMISYEIAIGITIVSLVMTYGTLDLRQIVKLQEAGSGLPTWGVFLQPIAFLTLWVCSFAETNRLPFDLPEGESELVAGYHSEYSGMKFALFFMGEYAAMYLSSAFIVTLFFGGYNIPFVSEVAAREFFMAKGLALEPASWVVAALQLGSYLFKSLVFLWIFVWVRWTLPRFRYDQLMDLGWKKLLPIGVINVIATMIVTYYLNRSGG